MRKLVGTALLFGLPAWVIASTWSRLEEPRASAWGWVIVAGLALAPALARPVWVRAPVAVAAGLAALNVAFHDAGIREPVGTGGRDLEEGLPRAIVEGFQGFYDVTVPFDAGARPLMHGLVLLAVFFFCAGVALAVDARRPLLAVIFVAAGAAWPATLRPSGDELMLGAFVLAIALVLLAAAEARSRSRLGRAVVAGSVILAGALALSSSPALAKQAFLDWKGWDLSHVGGGRVSVQYIWDSNYDGIQFPKQETEVLEIRASPVPRYWRATSLDTFTGYGWVEDALFVSIPSVDGDDYVAAEDRLLPPLGARSALVEQQVTVAGLRDRHLVGATVPAVFRPGELAPVTYASGGIAYAPRDLVRGDRYTVWSFAPRPTPRQLARSGSRYPAEIALEGRFLNVAGPSVSVPPFGTPDRDAWMRRFFDASTYDDRIRPYRPLYLSAREVVGRPRNPYAAVVALESWFRTHPGFEYDEQPPQSTDSPPLVDFLVRTKRGYCQHYAGAMALMLRYLGIPARVGAGFTPGSYRESEGVWTVTDRNAHTWVEVWFRGYGWLPFDPTPTRGGLLASYTSASPSFDASGAVDAVGRAGAAIVDALEALRANGSGPQAGIRSDPDSTPPGTSTRPGEPRGEFLRPLLAGAGALLALLALLKLAVRHGRYLTRDPRRRAGAVRAELAGFLLDQRVDVPPSATARELAALVATHFSVPAERFAAAVDGARFGPPAGAVRSLRSARTELRLVRRRLRRRLNPFRRARGLLSLRSLGIGV